MYSNHERGRPPSRLAIVTLCAALGHGACTDAEPDESDEVDWREQTIWVPPPPDCNVGVGPSRCLHVPPVHVEDPPRWEVDGVRGTEEYFHAIALPYANPTAKAAGGRVFVSVDDAFEAFHVFVEDAPLLDAREVRVLIDFNRFDQGSTWVNRADRGFSLDVDSGEIHDYRGSAAQWSVVDVGGFSAVSGGCEPDAIQDLRRCDAEFEIRILDQDVRAALLAASQGGTVAGIGLAVTDEGLGGASPEEIAEVSPSSSPDTNRVFFQTLLFGRPEGIPATIVTFNAHRFTPFMQALGPSGFDDVELHDIARALAPFDIVAVQEVWSMREAERLFGMIRQERQALNPDDVDYFWMPGGDFDPQFLLLEDFQSLADETIGGVHVYSKFPPASADYEVYSQCRGEDCLKAKGAQHVRLWLDPPPVDVPEGCGSTLDDGMPAPPLGCPLPSSHSRSLDVFNTHMQASHPVVCENVDLLFAFEAALAGWALPWYDDLIEAQFDCILRTDEGVRANQLAELDAFIVGVTQGVRRPSVVVGDFNIDGRDLAASEYRTLLSRLHVGPSSDPGDPEASDIVNAWRFDFDWDVDHGDIAREQFDPWPDPSDPSSNNTELVGTFIDEHASDEPGGRFDYILVRPPVQADLPGAGELDFVIAKGVPAWEKIWPGGIGSAPDRLSDHVLVAAAIELVQFQQPPGYHHDWNHEYTFRVSAVNATGHKDCWWGICGALELYPHIHATMLQPGGDTNVAGPFNGGNCGGNQSSHPADGCTNGWGFTDEQIAGLDLKLGAGARLQEDDDDPNPDDIYPTMAPGEHPVLFFDWDAAFLQVRDWSTGVATPEAWPGDHTIVDNAPIEWCTRGNPDLMCLRLELSELPPAGQF